jgi:hypothetical protein
VDRHQQSPPKIRAASADDGLGSQPETLRAVKKMIPSGLIMSLAGADRMSQFVADVSNPAGFTNNLDRDA